MKVGNAWARGFEAARAAALYSDAPKVAKRMGAALFSGSSLRAIGFNTQKTTHPRAQFGIHAELRALLKRRHHEDFGCTLYVYRELADGTPACSRPCQACMESIKESGSVSCVRFINMTGQCAEVRL